METEKALEIIRKLKSGEIRSAQYKDCKDYSSPYLEYNYDCLHCAFWYDETQDIFYSQNWNTDGFGNITHEEPKVLLLEGDCLQLICQYSSLFFVS